MTRLSEDVFNAAVCRRRRPEIPPGTTAVLIGAFCATSVVFESHAVTATINVAEEGIPKATLKFPRRLNATPEVGFKTDSTTPAAEQRVGDEIA